MNCVKNVREKELLEKCFSQDVFHDFQSSVHGKYSTCNTGTGKQFLNISECQIITEKGAMSDSSDNYRLGIGKCSAQWVQRKIDNNQQRNNRGTLNRVLFT